MPKPLHKNILVYEALENKEGERVFSDIAMLSYIFLETRTIPYLLIFLFHVNTP
jgi:hypothetical protein